MVDPSLASYPSHEAIDATLPHLDCINAILTDWNVDAPAFEERDAAFMPRGRETFLEPIHWYDENSGLGNVLLAARFLFVFDLGLVGDLEESQLVRSSFAKEMRRAGGGRKWTLNEAIYQTLADNIVTIIPASAEEEAKFGDESGHGRWGHWNGGQLTIFENAKEGGFESLAFLLHEVRHATGPNHVVIAGSSSDLGPDGSYGWEASLAGVVHVSQEWSLLSYGMDERLAENGRYSLERIERYRTGPDTWQQPWDGFPWLGKEDESPWTP